MIQNDRAHLEAVHLQDVAKDPKPSIQYTSLKLLLMAYVPTTEMMMMIGRAILRQLDDFGEQFDPAQAQGERKVLASVKCRPRTRTYCGVSTISSGPA